MIILSVGMPRAGSGWYYNIMHDLITASGGQDARVIRKQYHLQSILTEVNCNIGALTPRRLLGVLIPSLQGNTFVIKAHSGPTPLARTFLRRGWLRAAYIYRDPRDAMLSAFDNGQRALQKGHPNGFSHLTDFNKSVEFMQQYVNISNAWLKISQVLATRYENLKDDYDTEAARLLAFLRLDGATPAIQAVIERYRPEKARQGQQAQPGLHFNKGKTGRFRERMTPEEQEILAQRFGPYLQKMGYPE